MRGMKGWWLAALLGWCGFAGAQDQMAELADLKAKVASLEAARAGETVYVEEAEPEGVVSLRKNGFVKIGGAANVAAVTGNAEFRFRDAAGRDHAARVTSTDLSTQTAALNFLVEATENVSLAIKLDLDDAWDGKYQQDDFLEEIYFTFKNIGGSAFGVKFGKMELPYGYDKDVLLLSPYVHGTGNSFFATTFLSQRDVSGLAGITNFQTGAPVASGGSVLTEAHPHEYDNTFAFTPYVDLFCEQLRLEASIFQNREARDLDGRHRRTRDDGSFRSFAARATYKPVWAEGLTLSASAITRRDSDPYAGKVARNLLVKDAQAISLAAEYRPCFLPRLNVFAEWERGWNQGYYKDQDSDDIHFGASYDFTDRLTLHGQGEWLYQDWGARSRAAYVDTQLWRMLWAVQYKLCGGVTLEGGYQHEWLNIKGSGRPAGPNRYDADVFYLGTKFTF